MLCAVFAIPQCGFISFALRKVVIFHGAECDSGAVRTVRNESLKSGGWEG